MPAVSSGDARASLLRKGFKERPGRKHVFYDLYVEGRDAGIGTHFSRGKKSHGEIGDDMMRKMVPQLKLNRSRQVLELLDCSMSGEEYLSFLRSNGRLLPPRRL